MKRRRSPDSAKASTVAQGALADKTPGKPSPSSPGIGNMKRNRSFPLGLTMAFVLVVGLLIQTVRWEKQRISFYPPIFYLAGLSVSLCDARGASFAFALIWAINAGLPNAQGFLSVYALLMVLFGHFFGMRVNLSAIYAGVLCFLPVLLSLLAKRPLTVFSRRTARGHGRP